MGAAIKNLSINNIYVQLDFPERHDGSRQVIECQETAVCLLVAHQQFTKPIEPTVSHFNNPSPSLVPGLALEFFGFLPAPFDMRDVAMLCDDF